MEHYRKAIEDIAKRICADMLVSIYDIEEKMTQKGRIITVFLTKIGGVSLDECAKFSRAISAELDTLDLIAERYFLEVSSPGLERPLKLKMHYLSAINEIIGVQWSDADFKHHTIGKLVEVNPETIAVEVREGEQFLIPYSAINKAKTVLSENPKGRRK